MGLQRIDASGQLEYICHSGTCPPILAHISHPQVEHVAPDAVALAPCPQCGSRMTVKVAFSDAEMKASNMIDKDGKPTPSWQMAQRHIQLARQLAASGKLYRPLLQNSDSTSG